MWNIGQIYYGDQGHVSRLRHCLLHLWLFELHQRGWTNVFSQRFSWWCFPYLWYGSHCLGRCQSRRSNRSPHWSFSKIDQMHVPQIWSFWNNRYNYLLMHCKYWYTELTLKSENLKSHIVLPHTFLLHYFSRFRALCIIFVFQVFCIYVLSTWNWIKSN